MVNFKSWESRAYVKAGWQRTQLLSTAGRPAACAESHAVVNINRALGEERLLLFCWPWHKQPPRACQCQLTLPQFPPGLLSPPVALAAVSFPVSNSGSIHDILSPSSFRITLWLFASFPKSPFWQLIRFSLPPVAHPTALTQASLAPRGWGSAAAGFPGTAAAGGPGAERQDVEGTWTDTGGRCGRLAGARTRRCRGPRSVIVGTARYFMRTPWRNCLP